MTHKREFSDDFKKAAVAKLLMKGNRTVSDILTDLDISSPTLYKWKAEFGSDMDMTKKPSIPNSRSLQEKIKHLHEYSQLSEDKKGEYLRTHGLHSDNIKEWLDATDEALDYSGKKQSSKAREIAVERKKVKELRNELARKDKALAEASALLILKKKAQLIWGKEEESE